MTRRILGLAALGAMCAVRLPAQTDYRNLDDGRPVVTEDAWPIERRAMEFMLPWAWRLDGAPGASGRHRLEPEFMWGAMRNGMVGIKAPIVLGDPGLAGLRAFALYNFNAESPWWPGIAVRGDVVAPLGDGGGDAVTGAIKLIATRTWGTWRTHLNLSRGLGRERARPAVEPFHRWIGTLALDYSPVAKSVLFVAEGGGAQDAAGASVEFVMGLGVRWQFTPTLVLDAGWHGVAGDADGTMGISYTFGRTPRARGAR